MIVSKNLLFRTYQGALCGLPTRAFGTKGGRDEKFFLFFFGAPGVGKGTYSKRLAKDLKLNEVSTGDELRAIIKGKAEGYDPKFVKEITEIMNAGKFVGDNIVFDIIKKKIDESTNGIILDGFPRTASQFTKYQELFPLHLVMNFHLRKEVLVDKLLGRRICEKCGGNFNICDIRDGEYDMEPLLPKDCTQCKNGEFLKQRADDNKETIEARLKEYEQKTAPLLELFEKQGVLVNFEPKKGVKDYPTILQIVKDRLKLN
mmetsp:Transcript_29532/g.34134  ORF Transcript_29532/g.34134 Transcript_29532/m.34134 type:complete len:259 (-) Transcript_29532:157-933(-)